MRETLIFHYQSGYHSISSHDLSQADQLEPISIEDPLAAYSSVPMPYPGHGTLVSDFPEEMMARTYRFVYKYI